MASKPEWLKGLTREYEGVQMPVTGYAIKLYMRQEMREHVDLDTGEVNTTALAEDACQHFDAYGPAPDYDIPEDLFDWALEIAEGWE